MWVPHSQLLTAEKRGILKSTILAVESDGGKNSVFIFLRRRRRCARLQSKTKNVSNAASDSVQGKNFSILEPQISFSSFMSTADLEAHKSSFDKADLSLTHPEILVFCQRYAMVDPSFVPKLARVDVGSRYLVPMGVGKIMGMFLAFPPGQIPQAVHKYMVSLEKMTSLVVKALGLELPLLHKIVINSHSVSQPLLSTQGRNQLMRRLKRRRSSNA